MSRSGSTGPTVDEVNAFLVEAFPSAGNRCVAIGDGWAVARHDADPAALRPGDIISGPTIFGAVDVALWFALFGSVGIEPMALTSELSIRFLRPARGDALFARADLHHVGGRSVIGSVRCWMDDDEDTLVAVAQGTYVRPRN
ncbi:MAG: PaaI family thioesterase [Actinomycetota bacterium]